MRKLLFLFIIFPVIANSQTITDGLLGYWPFNGNANDVSINSFNGQIVGATITSGKDNQTGSAYLLSNLKYIDFGASEFSISAWIYKTQANDSWNTAFIGKWNNGGKPGSNEWHLSSGGNANDVPAFTIEMGSNSYRIDNSEQLSVNAWYHLMAVRKTTSIELYVNGELKSTLQVPAGEINNVGRDLLFGKFGGEAGAGVHYNQGAKIDEVMIFNSALNPQEIIELFSGEANEPLTPKAPADLVKNRPTDEPAP